MCYGMRRMLPFITHFPKAAAPFEAVAEQLLDAYEDYVARSARAPEPKELIDGIYQFITIATQLDDEPGSETRFSAEDVTRMGDYAVSLMSELSEWSLDLGLDEISETLDFLLLNTAYWVHRHGGTLLSLEPVVNAIANVANNLRGPEELAELTRFTDTLIASVADEIKHDEDSTDPNRPWRILLFNRGIMATRSHEPGLMERAFDDLVQYLPNDAPGFFSEAMQQMEIIKYPPPVRSVVERYFDRFIHHRMH